MQTHMLYVKVRPDLYTCISMFLFGCMQMHALDNAECRIMSSIQSMTGSVNVGTILDYPGKESSRLGFVNFELASVPNTCVAKLHFQGLPSCRA